MAAHGARLYFKLRGHHLMLVTRRHGFAMNIKPGAIERSNEPMDYDSILSERERQITALVATGATNKEIARNLFISDKTVKNTLTKIFTKTGARTRTELAIQVVCSGWHPTLDQSRLLKR